MPLLIDGKKMKNQGRILIIKADQS